MKYFYDDPVSAAYMALAFGIEFENCLLDIGKSDAIWYDKTHKSSRFWGPFRVTKKHFDKFQPKVGDITVNPLGRPSLIVKDDKANLEHSLHCQISPALESFDLCGMKIIFRKGKEFIFPHRIPIKTGESS